MSTPPKPVTRVLSILSAISASKILLVEGVEDYDVYSRWLKKLLPPGEIVATKVHLEQLEGKPTVLRVLEWFRDHEGNPTNVFGLTDRDEWDTAMVASKRAEFPQLRINVERHSLESYFCDPEEIGPALANLDSATFVEHLPVLIAQVVAELPARVDHWSLFTVTERVKHRMIDAQYPGIFHDQFALPDDEQIRDRLRQWSRLMETEKVFQEFSELRDLSRARSQSRRLRSCVWSGPFFDQVVCGGPAGLQSERAGANEHG